MKKPLFSLMLTAVATIVLAFSDTETRNIASFQEVSVATGIQATLVKGTSNTVEIEVDGIELDKVITEVKNGKLKVKVDQKWWKGWTAKRKVEVVITYTESLRHISASSGSSVTNKGTIHSKSLELDASSGASSTLTIEAESVNADVSSGARMTIKGTTVKLDVDASSGSSFRGFDLISTSVSADGSSGANIRVNASDNLNADVSSGASVKYKGSPESKSIDKSSGGSVKAAN